MLTCAVIEVAEGIPFVALTDWDPGKLYSLKGEIVSRGVAALTGIAGVTTEDAIAAVVAAEIGKRDEDLG